MDKFNVIEPSMELDSLEKEMIKWSLLTHDQKMRSDEECIRQFGKTNIELFNDIKASILDPVDPENTKVLEAVGFQLDNGNTYTIDNTDIITIAAKLNENPYIALVYGYNPDDIEGLNKMYTKYTLLPDKFKRFSNYYSQQLFGFNVPNMYNILLNKRMSNIEKREEFTTKVLESTIESKPERNIQVLLADANRAVCENDVITLNYYYKNINNIKECFSVTEGAILEKEIVKAYVDNNFKYTEETFEEFSAVPWFTPDEKYGSNLSNFEDPEYSANLMEAYRQHSYNNNDYTKKTLLKLGWNPEIPVTRESIDYAKFRQSNYINRNKCRIIDISNMVLPVQESSTVMRSLYKEKDLYPVYITLSFTNTIFGKIIRFLKKSTYTHAGLSLDSDLNNIVTFKYGDGTTGFEFENLELYIDTYDDALLQVLCIFVDGETKRKIEQVIKYYISHQEDTKYGFKNLFNILFKKKKTTDDYALELVCSQFVDHVLRLCGIEIIKKPNNLVIPQDYATVVVEHPKVFKLYEGLAKKYNERKIEGLIENLIRNYNDLKFVNEAGIEINIDMNDLCSSLVPSITTTKIEQ